MFGTMNSDRNHDNEDVKESYVDDDLEKGNNSKSAGGNLSSLADPTSVNGSMQL